MRPVPLAFWLVALVAASAQAGGACPLPAEAGAARPIASGLKWTEGPVYDAGRAAWLFSDVAGDAVYRVAAGAPPTPFKRPSGYANGNALRPDGTVVSARHDRQVVEMLPSGEERVLASAYGGRRLNSPNDLALGPGGWAYFTDPNFGIDGYGPARAAEEQPVRGVYRVSPDGRVELLSGDLRLPNGIAFAPDGRALYVSDTADGRIHAFAVGPDGRLADRRPFARAEPGVDGLKVDAAGRVWAAGPKGVAVHAPSGERLCALAIDAPHVSNLALGGRDGREVLITAADRVWLLTATEAVAPVR